MPNVVITGASTGIGRAAAVMLARRGYRVFAGVRRAEDARVLATLDECIHPLRFDITDGEALARVQAEVAALVGGEGLQGLVNNAGITMVGPLEFIPLEDLRQQFEVNVFGQVAVTQRFLPLLRTGGGRVVNIGSMAGYVSTPFHGSYCASKHALEALTDSLRRELSPWNLHVSLIEPGSVQTAIWEKGKERARRLLSGFSEPARALYGDAAAKMIDASDQVAARAAAPEIVARQICHALESPRPRTRYRSGWDAKLMRWVVWLLPDRLLDAFLRVALRQPWRPPGRRPNG